MDPHTNGRERHLLGLPPLDEEEKVPETLDELKSSDEGEGEPS